MPKINIEMELDEYKIFDMLLQALHVNIDEEIRKDAFTVEDGEIVVKDYDDRGELYIALYHLATKLIPNMECRSIFDDPNDFMSKIYKKKEKENK